MNLFIAFYVSCIDNQEEKYIFFLWEVENLKKNNEDAKTKKPKMFLK